MTWGKRGPKVGGRGVGSVESQCSTYKPVFGGFVLKAAFLWGPLNQSTVPLNLYFGVNSL